MEIDITNMVNEPSEMFNLSGSVCEHGQDAGTFTWNNSIEYAKGQPLLREDQLETAKKYFKTFGAWSDEEIKAWTNDEVQALAVQLVAGDIREMEGYDTYEDYLVDAEAGTVSSHIFRGDDNRFYYYFGE